MNSISRTALLLGGVLSMLFSGCAEDRYEGSSDAAVPEIGELGLPANAGTTMPEDDPRIVETFQTDQFKQTRQGAMLLTQDPNENRKVLIATTAFGVTPWVNVTEGLDKNDPSDLSLRGNGAGYVLLSRAVFNEFPGGPWKTMPRSLTKFEDANSSDLSLRLASNTAFPNGTQLVSGGWQFIDPYGILATPGNQLESTFGIVRLTNTTSAALLHVGANKDQMAHIWDNSFALDKVLGRPTIPATAYEIGVHVRAYIVGEAYLHFGMDFWRTATETVAITTPGDPNRTHWQAMISMSFHSDDAGGSARLIDLIMHSRIFFRNQPDLSPTEELVIFQGDEIVLVNP